MLLDLENLNVLMTISEQQMIEADHLVKILRDRFQQHLIHRVRDKCKRAHWSMQFAYSNLAMSAACMVLSNHTVDKLRCLQDLDSLLSPTPYNFYQCELGFQTVKERTSTMTVTKDVLFAVER